MTKSHNRRQMKSATRLYAVQALFQMEASGQSVEAVSTEFSQYRLGVGYDGEAMAEGDPELFTQILDDAVNFQAAIDQSADRALAKNWPIARIDPTIRAILRAAGAELESTQTPPKVVISEYVDVAKAFFPDGKEAKFVNAVLDHMARERHPEAFAG